MTQPLALDSAAPADNAASRIAGRYELLAQIGAGGMGAVFRARDTATGRIVALKQLKVPPGDRNARMLKALFEREFHTLARLKHPRIIDAYDYGVSADGPYYTMELLEGKDIQALAPLPYREACRLLRDVASSLALIHAHRLVHRDVSPRNVRLTADGRAKLIDFGALAGFGPAAEVIGTPTCIAPESLQRAPLDQRTDLFALGAVMYWALTGRPAYPARAIQELTSVWKTPPQPPSALKSDIPPALDALVASLLNIDPAARPASAAVVIDQLSLIAELPPEEDSAQAAESYLASGRMVGRDTERDWMKRRMLRALDGRGSEVVLDGPAGIGKTRLLRELGVIAQLEAIVSVHADAQATPSSYGVASTLGIQLLSVCPEIARAAGERHASLLGHLSPELHAKLDHPELTALADDPNERRARLQTALHDWFMTVARKLPLLIAVDNIQAADDDSAAFLAAIGRESRTSRMVLVVTQRTGEPVVAVSPVRALRKRSGHLKLAGLTSAVCEELVTSLFGDVANTGRTARLLHERSAGNPGQCMELARLLVRKQIARYVGGTWILPLEISDRELPFHMAEVLTARLGMLSPPARALAEALSIHSKPVSLERCLALGQAGEQERTHAALDELVAEQIVVTENGHYRFEQTALRRAVLVAIEPLRSRELHRRAAQTLLASGNAIDLRVEAAWHLLQAGDEIQGADMLAVVGRDYVKNNNAQESLGQVVHGLATALEVYERHGRSKYDLSGLMCMAVPAAFFVDRHITLKYGMRAVEIGLDITGLGLAQRASRYVGKKLGLVVGFIVAAVRFAKEQRRGLAYTLKDAIEWFVGMVPGTVGTFNICYDIDKVRELTKLLEPLRLFGGQHISVLMHDSALGNLAMGEGREADAHAIMVQQRTQFNAPAILEMLGPSVWGSIYGSVVFSLGILNAYRWGKKPLENADEMDTLGIRFWGMAADQLRMLYHALRGETEEVQHYRDRVELFAVQGGSTWQAELFWPVLLLGAEMLTRDTLSIRRLWEQLSRRAIEVPGLAVYAEAAQAAYLSSRGEHAAAIAYFEKALPQLPPKKRVAWSSIRAAAAESFTAVGKPERAKQLVLEVLEHATPADYEVVGRFLEPQRQLALAEAGLGNHAEAVRMLDVLLDKHGAEDQPLLIGLLHKARAEVALQMKDAPAFEQHAAEVERHFRSTKNSALIAQWERLIQQAVRRGVRRALDAAVGGAATNEVTAVTVQQRIVSELASAGDPHEFALRLVVQESRAAAGYLYVYHHGGMQLASQTTTEEPPRTLEAELLQRAQRVEFEAAEATKFDPALDGVTVADSQHSGVQPAAAVEPPPRDAAGEDDEPATQFVVSEPPPAADDGFELFILSTKEKGKLAVVGGVIAKSGPAGRPRIDPGVLASVARVLYDRLSSTVM